MVDVYSKLEFEKIKQKIKYYIHSELAQSYCDKMEMFEEDELQDELNLLDEAMMYASKYQGISVSRIKNIMKDLMNLNKEGTASLEFFVNVSLMLSNINDIKKNYIIDDAFPHINEMVNSLYTLDSLRNRIDSIVDKDMSIFDNASSKLNSIRFQIKKEEEGQSKIVSNLMNKYRPYLNDERMAMRAKGLTLPIKANFKNKINGITLDVSDSGNTYFIMPIEIIASDNKIATLKDDEKEEILRILKDLASYCGKSIVELKDNLFTLASLDFLFAKVNYAFEIKGVIATKDDNIELVEARHPLIDINKVVSNTIDYENKKIVLITGPNAGGKTVCLKTLGLMVLMNQCGLALPCKKAKLPYFENVFVDIGDEQSLSDNLSTFTSHMRALKHAILNVNNKSLVLIDELGTGTSPNDGEALGVGVISYLHEHGAYAMLSSHYDGLKSYAFDHDYILNASMIFDEINLKSTYKLVFNISGKSYGLEVALREGIPSTIIDKAKLYEKEKMTLKEKSIDILNQRLLEVEKLKKELEEKNKLLVDQIALKEKESEKLKQEKDKLEESFNEEKNKLLEQAKAEVEEMMNQFKAKKDIKLHEVIQMKKALDEKIVSEDEEDDSEVKEIFNVNDRVEEKESKVKGYIKSISKDTASVLLDSGLTLKIKLSSLNKVKLNNKVKKVKTPDFVSNVNFNKTLSLECNVIGLHVSEALDVVAKYLDDARSMKYHRVRIVHGNGTGKLRIGIHEFLKKQKYVEKFEFATSYEGGVGATVVYLK